METPKPPASSQLRRPSTRPYARRRPRGADEAEAAEPATDPALDGAAPAAAVATAAAAAVAKATAVIEAPVKKPPARGRSKKTSSSDLPGAASATSNDAAMIAVPTTPIDAALLSSLVAATSQALAALEAAPLAAPAEISPPAAISPAEIPQLTALPSPRQLPTGAPADAAPPPGLVPRGDSRSLRRGELFALVYRVHCFVITRHGQLGQLGHWSAIEYPTPTAASNAYARSASHWVSEGFSDYRG